MIHHRSTQIEMTAKHVEIAVANHMNHRVNLIVPNVSWGMGMNYEADIVVLRPSNIAVEVEIKVSRSDIKADIKKRHQHDSPLFKAVYFAVPKRLADDPSIPTWAGVLSCTCYEYRGCVYFKALEIRKPRMRKDYAKWTDAQRLKLLHLAAMRVWSMKETQIKKEVAK